MNKDLENKFFAEFDIDGAADMALDMVLWKHCGISSGTSTRAERYNDDVLAEIAERTEKAKVWLYNSNGFSALFEEVEDNVIECKRVSKEEVTRFIGKILQKFSRWAFRYNRWSEQLRSVDDTIYYGTIEDYYTSWRNDYLYFAERLAVILAEREISLEAIQEEYDVKIFDGFDIEKHWHLFGTRERAERVLSKISNCEASTEISIIKTDRAVKYFAKAIQNGFMEPTTKGYRWLYGGERGGKARLAYFLVKVYCPARTDTLQAEEIRQLERAFNTKPRLDRAMQQNVDTGKSQAVQKWREKIDELFLE
ncbi:MAG: hypothetical protein J1F05_08000 [Muribaculaceae bacterium]|nr:hypothetical protein [Muribaculaceae bacterium]